MHGAASIWWFPGPYFPQTDHNSLNQLKLNKDTKRTLCVFHKSVICWFNSWVNKGVVNLVDGQKSVVPTVTANRASFHRGLVSIHWLFGSTELLIPGPSNKQWLRPTMSISTNNTTQRFPSLSLKEGGASNHQFSHTSNYQFTHTFNHQFSHTPNPRFSHTSNPIQTNRRQSRERVLPCSNSKFPRSRMSVNTFM